MITRWRKYWRQARKSHKLAAIDETLSFLKQSKDSGYAHATVSELIDQFIAERRKIEAGDSSADDEISDLFLPTGCLQDTAEDNGWGGQYIELAYRLRV